MGSTRGGALFLATCAVLLRAATPFVRPGSGIAASPSVSASQRRLVHPVIGRRGDDMRTCALLFSFSGCWLQYVAKMMAEVDADIPGVADSRLAGWRVGSREAAGADETAAETSSASSEGRSSESGEPGCGDVVEYPLSDLVKSESGDDRQKGVAVIVSINKLRNDAWKLPEDILDKAELQVLCPDLDNEEGSMWMADELESCAFAKLGEMKVLKSSFNGAMDKWKRWKVFDELSEGCGARDAEWEYDML